MNLSLLILKSYATLLRLLTPNSGLTRLSFNRPVNRLFGAVPKVLPTVTAEGVKIDVDVTDYHGRILWLFGSNDFKVSRTVNALLEPTRILLDIGANYSTIGLSAAHAMGGKGSVHLFEPQPGLAAVVRRAIAGAGLDSQVTLHEVALFDSDGTMELSVPSHHSGMSSLVRSAPEGTSVMVAVKSTRPYLEPLVQGQSFGVKIDIEGAEPSVLPGLFEMGTMRFCVFEGANHQQVLLDLFRGADFEIFGLCRTIFSVRVQHVSTIEEFRKFHDFVAIKASGTPPAGPVSLRRLKDYMETPSRGS